MTTAPRRGARGEFGAAGDTAGGDAAAAGGKAAAAGGKAATECNAEQVEALLHGELDASAAVRALWHTAACPRCQRELQWLRVEQDLTARRRAAQDRTGLPELYDGVAARLLTPPQARRGHPLAWVAALLLLALSGQERGVRALIGDPVAGLVRRLVRLAADHQAPVGGKGCYPGGDVHTLPPP